MNYKFIDTHSHIHDKAFDEDRGEVILNMQKENIATITIGTDIVESKKAEGVANMYDNVWFTIGVHPCDDCVASFDVKEFEKLLTNKKCVAIGECGLDYFYLKNDRKEGKIKNIDSEIDRQRDLFIEQIYFALKHDLPLMLHGRPSVLDEVDNPNGMDAYEDMIYILKNIKDKLNDGEFVCNGVDELITKTWAADRLRGNAHFFVGNIDIAKQFLELGFDFSIGGVVTLTDEYNNLIKFLPENRIHAETDSPYVSPKDKDGKRVSRRNSPLNINIIIKKLTEIKGLDYEKFCEQLFKNSKRLYNI